MRILKNKKTGKEYQVTDQEYADMVNAPNSILNRFTVTEMRFRPIIPSIKTELPTEVKKIKKKNEG